MQSTRLDPFLHRLALDASSKVMQGPRIRLPTLTESQAQVQREARRFNVLACGRRWGKTTLAAIQLAKAASIGQLAGYFTPSHKLASETYREVRRLLMPVTRYKSDTDRRIETQRGGVVEFWSLDDPDAGRSRKYHLVAIDEAAQVRNLEYSWNASIRPTLTDYQGEAWFYSSPRGRNYFWRLFQRGIDPSYPDWAAWQMPTGTNPYIEPDEIEQQRRELPEMIFQQEFMAQFIEEGAGVFRHVLELSLAEPHVDDGGRPAARPDGQYVIGVDWGKSNDFTAISVWEMRSRSEAYLERFNQIDYHLQSQRLKLLVDAYRPKVVLVEENSIGAVQLEALTRMGIQARGFYTSSESKAELIEALALALEQRSVQLLNDPIATGEMLAFEATRTPSGRMRYAAPAGQHDDTVMARALAYYACVPAYDPKLGKQLVGW